MKLVCRLVSTLFLIVAPIGQIYAYPGGAPAAACSSMTPQHGASPKDTSSPFSTTLPDGYSTMMGKPVRLELRSTINLSSFKGFLVQAFKSGTDKPIGTFSHISDGHTLDCSGVGNAATHSNPTDKKLISMTWTPPADLMGDVVFKTTFVLEKATFWVKTESKPLTIGHTASSSTTKPEIITTSLVIVISLMAFLMRF